MLECFHFYSFLTEQVLPKLKRIELSYDTCFIHTYVSLPIVRNTDTLRGIAVSRGSRRATDSSIPWTSRGAARSRRAWRARRSCPAFSWWT